MKITLVDEQGNIKRRYNHSEEIILRKKTKRIKILDHGIVQEVFEYIKVQDLSLREIETTGNDEVFLTVVIGKPLYDADIHHPHRNILEAEEATNC